MYKYLKYGVICQIMIIYVNIYILKYDKYGALYENSTSAYDEGTAENI
jgi:hypothetical protein